MMALDASEREQPMGTLEQCKKIVMEVCQITIREFVKNVVRSVRSCQTIQMFWAGKVEQGITVP